MSSSTPELTLQDAAMRAARHIESLVDSRLAPTSEPRWFCLAMIPEQIWDASIDFHFGLFAANVDFRRVSGSCLFFNSRGEFGLRQETELRNLTREHLLAGGDMVRPYSVLEPQTEGVTTISAESAFDLYMQGQSTRDSGIDFDRYAGTGRFYNRYSVNREVLQHWRVDIEMVKGYMLRNLSALGELTASDISRVERELDNARRLRSAGHEVNRLLKARRRLPAPIRTLSGLTSDSVWPVFVAALICCAFLMDWGHFRTQVLPGAAWFGVAAAILATLFACAVANLGVALRNRTYRRRALKVIRGVTTPRFAKTELKLDDDSVSECSLAMLMILGAALLGFVAVLGT